MDIALQPLVLFALLVAMVLTAYEMRASLAPPACPECPHCKALAAERERRDRELEAAYARQHRLNGDEDDDRRIG
jgi:hypothetical protein